AITAATRVAGKVGGALSFNGTSSLVTVTDPGVSPLDLTTGMTLEAWVNPTTLNGWDPIVIKENTANVMSYALYANDGAPQAGGTNFPAGYARIGGADRVVRGVSPLSTGVWTHVATTYDGATQRIYINGNLVASRAQTGAIGVGNGSLRIGGDTIFTNEFYQGLIDEVRVYNRALTAAEIGLDMSVTDNGGVVVTPPPPPPPPPPPTPPPPPPPPSTTGLVLSLTFDEASGTTAIDSSASGLNGTITGAVHVPGRVGNALSFNGTSDWVTVVDNTPIDLTTGMTLEAWVNPASLSGWNTVMLKERGVNGLSYGIYANDGAPQPGGLAV